MVQILPCVDDPRHFIPGFTLVIQTDARWSAYPRLVVTAPTLPRLIFLGFRNSCSTGRCFHKTLVD